MPATRLARKISQKAIVGYSRDELRQLAADNGEVPLFTAIGTARGYRSGETQYGPWTCLTGEFEAVNLSTGEVHNGGRIFLPPYVNDMIMPAIVAGGENSAIEFAILVGVKPAENAFGFEYYTESYQDPAESESMKRLKTIIPPFSELQKQLPPPSGKKEDTTDEE